MAEYATMAHSFDLKKEVSTIPSDELSKQMAIVVGKYINEIATASEKFQGGNWTILSHSSTVVGNRLLVTVILRR